MDDEEVVETEDTETEEGEDTPEHTIDDVYDKLEDIIDLLTTNL